MALINYTLSDGKLFLAPMAGYSDSPFRKICRDRGADVVVTEMVNAIGLTMYRSDRKIKRYIAHDISERPIGVQIFGSDPETLSEAAQIGENMGFSFIDINMGCPVKKIMKTGAGAALLKNQTNALEIVKEVKKRISIPLSVKIRAGWDRWDRSYLSFSESLFNAGVDLLIVHPRDVLQGMNGPVDHGKTAEIKRVLSKGYIVANGGIMNSEDGVNILEKTGCDGLMIGRGALINPNIFNKMKSALSSSPSSLEPLKHLVIKHLKLMIGQYGARAAILFRKNISWYTKALPDATRLRRRANEISDPEELIVAIERFF